MASTFRQDLITGMLAMLNAYIAANPTLLVRAFKVRPGNLVATDLPCAYIDLRPETIAHAAGVRTRTMSPSVVVVDRLTDNAETLTRLDSLTDALVDWFTGYPHIVAGTVWDQMTVGDESVSEGTEAVRFTFGNIEVIEGRN